MSGQSIPARPADLLTISERLTISHICEQQFALRDFVAKVKQNPELNTDIESAALTYGLEPKEFQVNVESGMYSQSRMSSRT